MTDKTPISPSVNLPPDLARGTAYLKAEVRKLGADPGVYRMTNGDGEVLYVGKARNLARRVASYTQPNRLPNRLMRMVSETEMLEVIVTKSETEALLLESNLIKKMKPRYNILLRDDKSLPQILMTADHPFGQLTKHRGRKARKGDYFGPFASAGAVNRTVADLARAFMLRTCSDSVFGARTRPCLQYQIKRCSGPCVGLVTETDYAAQMDQARRFLSGESAEIQRDYADRMHAASEKLEFETAAIWRNRIRALSGIQASQDINVPDLRDADIIALSRSGEKSCIQTFFIRGGSNYGNRSYFMTHNIESTDAAVLTAFIGQFYDDKKPPSEILVSVAPDEVALLGQALSTSAGRTVRISRPQRGPRTKLTAMASRNAEEALARNLADTSSQRRLLAELGDLFGMDAPPERVEVYDNSHIQGRHAVGGMIIAGPDGFNKAAYRKFNMRKDGPHAVTQGDDFAMMRQVIHRRFERVLREDPDRDGETWPDLLLIDGGKGQLSAVAEVMDDLGVADIAVVAISKGPDRNAGREQFHMRGRDSFTLSPQASAMHFLQRLRDEAHRYAIGTHRARRQKSELTSPLDGVPGIGPRRKKALLAHFGSARAVSAAGLRDLEAVDGISKAVARQIFDWFYSGQS
ncbi:MAG: excinuclease ABC subunit C [Rhodospirillaceae bacterium]|nr:excinuclease ABC subunit C [Rhodospirillaceae bacterium]